MKRKPIKIDWDELEDVFSNPQQVAAAYLDRITGRIFLEGEGEDEGIDHDDPDFEPSREVVAATRGPQQADPTRLSIHPPDTDLKIEWLKRFLAQAADEHSPEVVAELRAGMDVEDPASELRAIFRRNLEIREAWYVYRTERIQEMIDAWLAEHGVETTAPPPWRT